MKTGFIYQWNDLNTGLKYIGRHEGTLDDGYIASGVAFLKEYNKRPYDFERIILWLNESCTSEDLLKKEEEFLEEISENELFYGSDPKYYNIVKNSSGYTSSHNPMKNKIIVEKMVSTQKVKGYKDPWQNLINTYGFEGACKLRSEIQKGNVNGKGNLGKSKSEEHRKKIAESIRTKHAAGNYYTKKPGRKKLTSLTTDSSI